MKDVILKFFISHYGLYPILIGSFGVLCLLILRYRQLKLIHKDKVSVIQAAELHHKTLITRDQYHLQTFKQIIPDADTIVIAIHSLQGQKDDFKQLAHYCKQKKWSLIAYDRRGEGKNVELWKFQSFATDINDVNDAVTAVQAKFPQQRIFLFGEGLGAALVTIAAQKNHAVSGIIISNLITKYHLASFSIGLCFRIFFGFCFWRHLKIPFYINPTDISSNQAYITNMRQRYSQKQVWTMAYWWQMKTLNQKAARILPKLTHSTLILQSADDVFSDFHQLKVLNKRWKNHQTYYFHLSGKHVLSNEAEMQLIFNEKITPWMTAINQTDKLDEVKNEK